MKLAWTLAILAAAVSTVGACASEAPVGTDDTGEVTDHHLAELDAAYEETGLTNPRSLSQAATRAIVDLVERTHGASGDHAWLEKMHGAYVSLSARELDAFNLLRMRRQIEELEAAYQPQDSETAARYEAEVADARRLARARVEVNRLAQERHGKGSNAITAEQLDAILDEVLSNTSAASSAQGSSPFSLSTASDISVQACTVMSFNQNASKREGSGPGWYEYAHVTKTGQSDCDWRFSYIGTYSHIDPEDLNSELLVRAFGNHTAMAHYQAYLGSSLTPMTRIIFGANRVWFFCGGPSDVNVTMN